MHQPIDDPVANVGDSGPIVVQPMSQEETEQLVNDLARMEQGYPTGKDPKMLLGNAWKQLLYHYTRGRHLEVSVLMSQDYGGHA